MKLTDFDRIQMLCLDERRNTWRSTEKQFSDRGAKVERFVVGKGEVLPKEKYDFVDPKKPGQFSWNNYSWNAYCCFLSHRKILKKAIKDKVETLLLLEDDVLLLDNFDSVFDTVSRENHILGIEDSWDMFYFSQTILWGIASQLSEHVLKLEKDCYCWHAVAIKNHMFKTLLELPPEGPFDLLSARYIQTNPYYQVYGIWPSVAIQRDGISYVEGSYQTYQTYLNDKGANQIV